MNEEERKELAHKIEVMQAALDGKEVEYQPNPGGRWVSIGPKGCVSWNWLDLNYRVKPEGFEVWADVSGWTIGKEQVRIGEHCVNIDAAKAIWYAAVKAENDKRNAKELSW